MRLVLPARQRGVDHVLRAARVDADELFAVQGAGEAGDVDDGVHALQCPVQRRAVEDVALRDLDGEVREAGAVGGLADQAAKLVAVGVQRLGGVRADEAGDAGDEDVHGLERLLEDPVGLAALAAERGDGPVDEVVVLERPGDLARLVALAAAGAQGLEREDGVEPAAAVTLDDAEGDQTRLGDLVAVVERLEEASGEEAAIERASRPGLRPGGSSRRPPARPGPRR